MGGRGSSSGRAGGTIAVSGKAADADNLVENVRQNNGRTDMLNPSLASAIQVRKDTVSAISVKMKYAEYINEWNDCATVKDSYDSETKTISVLIPDYIYDMWKTIPAEDIEAYKEELIASGNVRYAKTGRVVSIYCEDLKGAKMSDFVDNAPAWVEKAIKIANRA